MNRWGDDSDSSGDENDDDNKKQSVDETIHNQESLSTVPTNAIHNDDSNRRGGSLNKDSRSGSHSMVGEDTKQRNDYHQRTDGRGGGSGRGGGRQGRGGDRDYHNSHDNNNRQPQGRGGRKNDRYNNNARADPSDWKSAAKASSSLLPKSKDNAVDGSDWMAQRRAKVQQKDEMTRDAREKELREHEEERIRRRSSQLQALKEAVQKMEQEKAQEEPVSSLQAAAMSGSYSPGKGKHVVQFMPRRDCDASHHDDNQSRSSQPSMWTEIRTSHNHNNPPPREIRRESSTGGDHSQDRLQHRYHHHDDDNRSVGSHGRPGRGGRGRGDASRGGSNNRSNSSGRDSSGPWVRAAPLSSGSGRDGGVRRGRSTGSAPDNTNTSVSNSISVAVQMPSGTKSYHIDAAHPPLKVLSRTKQKNDVDESSSHESREQATTTTANSAPPSSSSSLSRAAVATSSYGGGGNSKGRGGDGGGDRKGGRGGGREHHNGRGHGGSVDGRHHPSKHRTSNEPANTPSSSSDGMKGRTDHRDDERDGASRGRGGRGRGDGRYSGNDNTNNDRTGGEAGRGGRYRSTEDTNSRGGGRGGGGRGAGGRGRSPKPHHIEIGK